jgi:opacity protein-like surface antigen
MFGPRSKKAPSLALLLAFFGPSQAYAKNYSFSSSTPLGLGILGGLENKPSSGFAANSPTTSSPYASYVAMEPFFDLGNVCFRAHVGWHFYPLLSSGGTDSTGTFTENSNAGSFEYGGRVELAPFISVDHRSRFYLVFGMNDSLVRIKNERKFTTGTYAGKTLSDQIQGTGTNLTGGIGFETFLVQNWSIAFEVGYSHVNAESFTYRTSTNLDGQPVASGATVTDSSGNDIGFHSYTPYGQVVLNLNL